MSGGIPRMENKIKGVIMFESEKNQQRKIGKQLMIVRMVHYANDTAATYLKRKDICNWAEMTEKDIPISPGR